MANGESRHRQDRQVPRIESSDILCWIIVIGSNNIFNFIAQKTISTLVTTS